MTPRRNTRRGIYADRTAVDPCRPSDNPHICEGRQTMSTVLARIWVPAVTVVAVVLGAAAALAAPGLALAQRRGGSVTAIDCSFADNDAALLGPDVAGGAIYGIGVGATTIVGCTFTNNRAALPASKGLPPPIATTPSQ